MNSKCLSDKGFTSWQRFSMAAKDRLIEALKEYKAAGVYVIRRKKPFGRFRGAKSDLVYIGHASESHTLYGRIRTYFSEGKWRETSARVHDRLLIHRYQSEAFEIAWKKSKTTAAAQRLERQLLEEYEEKHGELPPLNRNQPKAKARRTKSKKT